MGHPDYLTDPEEYTTHEFGEPTYREAAWQTDDSREFVPQGWWDSPDKSDEERAVWKRLSPPGEPEPEIDPNARKTYYHVTDRPDFALDPSFTPTDMMGDRAPFPGIYLSPGENTWRDNFAWGEDRPYTAEIEGPADLMSSRPMVTQPVPWDDPVPGEEPDEFFVPAHLFPDLKLKNVRHAMSPDFSQITPEASPKPTTLYRGIRVDLPPELLEEMREKMVAARTIEEAGRELDLGPKILNHLSSQPWETTIGMGLHDWTGLGPHWHDDPRLAHTAAYGDLDERQQGNGKRMVPLLMSAEWDGEGRVDAFGGDGIENETQLPQGHPLNITSLVYQPEIGPDGQLKRNPAGMNSVELLHNSRYDRHGIHSGGPMTYTARRHRFDPSQRTARHDPSQVTAAVNQDLVDNLGAEFSNWYDEHGYDLDEFSDDHLDPISSDQPARGPIGDWSNVERFLNKSYPAAYRGLEMGLEEAGQVLDHRHQNIPYLKDQNIPSYETGQGAIDQYGYDPAEVAASFVLLHNRSHPFRGDMGEDDVRRLHDIAQKRRKMQRDYESRQSVTAAIPNLPLVPSPLFPDLKVKNVREAVHREASYITAAPVRPELVDQIEGEFNDWWDSPEAIPGEDYNWIQTGDEPQAPINHWGTIENFMEQNYPEAHKGLWYGLETAGPMLGLDSTTQEVPDWLKGEADEGVTPYETGQAVMDQYGYDPKEVAAAMLLLHNQSHGYFRENLYDEDVQRLHDIAQKRHKMQRDFQERVSRKLLSQDWNPQEVTDRLRNEFYDWTDKQPVDRYTDSEWNYGIGNWGMVEDFLQDDYPAAHRGFDTGWEDASQFLDDPNNAVPLSEKYDPEEIGNYFPEPYQTPLDQQQELGYDPEEIVAGLVLLHNQAHGARGGFDVNDRKRLVDIYQKRQKMQRDYESRQSVTAARVSRKLLSNDWNPQEVTDRLNNEFYDWQDQQPEDRYDDETWNAGAGRWTTVEDFLHDVYPAAHRGFWAGREDAGEFLDDPGEASTVSNYQEPNEYGDPSVDWQPEPYQTDPDTIQSLGYDPEEIVAGMIINHLNSNGGGGGGASQMDKKRLVDIYQKRQKMQRDYEQRISHFLRVAGFDPNEVTRQLKTKFDDWAQQNSHRLQPTSNYGPERDWKNIESFLEDVYPAAHRGLNYGREQAQDVLDHPQDIYGVDPYETGPDAVEQYGYDPKEMAAGALLLHNRSHPFRMDWSTDLDRLTDIAQKRHKMQRDYESRTANRVAMP